MDEASATADGLAIEGGAPLIELRHVSKTYMRGRQPTPVFAGVSLTIPRGDFVAVTGPSGSGKTTLLNMLGGLDRPSSGELIFDGADLACMPEGRMSAWRAENVGFIFQFCNLMPSLSAAANIELPLLLAPLNARQRQERVRTALEVVGLSDRASHKPSELSGGQQQRVAIARAVIADPKIILADEPTGDLDRATSIEILEMLRLLNQEFGKTIVMVTHDPVAAGYANRELHLDKSGGGGPVL